MPDNKLFDSVPHPGLQAAKEALMSTPKNIVLVFGSRTWADRERLFKALDDLYKERKIDLLVHGGAKGADQLGGQWAALAVVSTKIFHADWKNKGKAAGFIRNTEMAKWLAEQQDNGHTVTAVAAQVGNSPGTAHMIKTCKGLGLHGFVIRKEA